MKKPETTKTYELADNQRWRSYRNGILDHPSVRKAELEATLALLNPKPHERILEIGAGSGYLSLPIASALSEGGHLTAADINREGLAQLKSNAGSLPLDTFYFSDALLQPDKFAELYQTPFDAICSLAGFHHFDNRVENSGDKGRAAFIKEALAMLKPGGRLIIVDVGGDTPTQQYFDAIDDPYYFAPCGHPHNFQTPDELAQLALECGFSQAEAQIKSVPWVFNHQDEAKAFIHAIHNAQCSYDESFDIARKILGFCEDQAQLALNWQLMFFSAVK